MLILTQKTNIRSGPRSRGQIHCEWSVAIS